jgi:hypothetical protein
MTAKLLDELRRNCTRLSRQVVTLVAKVEKLEQAKEKHSSQIRLLIDDLEKFQKENDYRVEADYRAEHFVMPEETLEDFEKILDTDVADCLNGKRFLANGAVTKVMLCVICLCNNSFT